MIYSLNYEEPILSSSKEQNVLVLVKYLDRFIEYAIFESWFAALFFWLITSAPLNGLRISIPVYIQAIVCLRVTSL